MKSRQSLSKAEDEPVVLTLMMAPMKYILNFSNSRDQRPSRSPSCSPPPLMHVDDVVGKPSVESSQSKVFGDSRSVKPPCDSEGSSDFCQNIRNRGNRTIRARSSTRFHAKDITQHSSHILANLIRYTYPDRKPFEVMLALRFRRCMGRSGSVGLRREL